MSKIKNSTNNTRMETIKTTFRNLSQEYQKNLQDYETRCNEILLKEKEKQDLYNVSIKKNNYDVGTNNPKRAAEEYERLQDDLENIYNVQSNTYNDELRSRIISINAEIFKLQQKNKLLEKMNVCKQSWIEHLEYVINLSKVNDKGEMLTIINKKLADKKNTWVASGSLYLIWFKAGVCALDWCVETLFN